MSKNKNNKKLVLLYIVFGILGRLIPHPANFTPITNICTFSGAKLPKYLALSIMLILMAISDVLLAYMKGYPAFGSWTIFTYSGFIAMILFSSKLTSGTTAKRLLKYIVGFTLAFWVWTNFGSWLFSPFSYPKTLTGLITCYVAALPFLRNALIGNMVWMLVIWGSFAKIKQLKIIKGYISDKNIK